MKVGMASIGFSCCSVRASSSSSSSSSKIVQALSRGGFVGGVEVERRENMAELAGESQQIYWNQSRETRYGLVVTENSKKGRRWRRGENGSGDGRKRKFEVMEWPRAVADRTL